MALNILWNTTPSLCKIQLRWWFPSKKKSVFKGLMCVQFELKCGFIKHKCQIQLYVAIWTSSNANFSIFLTLCSCDQNKLCWIKQVGSSTLPLPHPRVDTRASFIFLCIFGHLRNLIAAVDWAFERRWYPYPRLQACNSQIASFFLKR